jgi:thioesterase domain-containing protein
MTTTAQRLAELSPEKQALLRRRLAERGRPEAPMPAGAGTSSVLSFAQRRLWFLDQLEPGSTAYNIVEGIRLHVPPTEPFRLDVLHDCMRALVRRHDVLRTTFVVDDGEPRQRVAPELEPPFGVTDLRDLEPDAREAEALRIASREAAAPFDLSRGPLLRVHVLVLQPHELVFVLAIHHIIFDGWSLGVALHELAELYQARVTGTSSALPPLPMQYADYARWQRAQLARPQYAALLAYWRAQLTDLPVLDLPVDHPRGEAAVTEGGRASFRLPDELSADLVGFARHHNVTMFMLLLAGFHALLARYTGQDRIAVGTPIAGRTEPELEPLIGFFVNTLVLCADVEDDPTFATHLARVRETALGAFAHQDMPFEQLVEELRPKRQLGRPPLFQVMFSVKNLQHLRAAPADPGGATIYRGDDVHAERKTAQFELSLGMEDHHGWCGSFEYDTARFAPETIARMIRHFEAVLRAAITAPERRLSELVLDDGEAVPVLRRSGATPAHARNVAPAADRAAVAPRDELELRLARLWQTVLGCPVHATDNFFALGGHSFHAIALMSAIAAEFGRKLPVAALFQRQTLEELAAALREVAPEGAPSCVVPLQLAGPGSRPGLPGRPVLFCVHPIGGNVLCYAELARQLGAAQTVYGLQAHGLTDGAAPDRSLSAMAARYAEAVRAIAPRGPYLLAGWSFGGAVAFEIARQLEAAGHEVGHVLALDSWASWGDDGAPSDAQCVRWFLDDLAGHRQDLLAGVAADAPVAHQLAHGLDAARAARLVPPGTDLAALSRQLAVFQANLEALRAHTPGAIRAPLTLFKARNNPRGAGDPDHGWAGRTSAFTVCDVPGDHYTLLQPRHALQLADAIAPLLLSVPVAGDTGRS